jgi:hypothetical protein
MSKRVAKYEQNVSKMAEERSRLTYKQPWADLSLAPRPARPGDAAAQP